MNNSNCISWIAALAHISIAIPSLIPNSSQGGILRPSLKVMRGELVISNLDSTWKARSEATLSSGDKIRSVDDSSWGVLILGREIHSIKPRTEFLIPNFIVAPAPNLIRAICKILFESRDQSVAIGRGWSEKGSVQIFGRNYIPETPVARVTYLLPPKLIWRGSQHAEVHLFRGGKPEPLLKLSVGKDEPIAFPVSFSMVPGIVYNWNLSDSSGEVAVASVRLAVTSESRRLTKAIDSVQAECVDEKISIYECTLAKATAMHTIGYFSEAINILMSIGKSRQDPLVEYLVEVSISAK